MTKFAVIGRGTWGVKVAAAIKALGFECDNTVSGREGVDGVWFHNLVQWADIVFIATHPVCCVEMARHALSNGKLTVVEKPVGFDAREVKDLVDLSRANKVPLIVDYVHLFSPSLTRFMDDDLSYLKIEMGGDGPVRDYSVLWDYGSHAIAIAIELINKPIESITVETRGQGCFFVGLKFHQCIAEIDVSNTWAYKKARIQNGRIPNHCFYEPQGGNPLAALISTAARLHLRGEYFTNGALAVEVTDVLERLHAMLPTPTRSPTTLECGLSSRLK